MSDNSSVGTDLAGAGKIAHSIARMFDRVSDAVGGLCAPWQVKRVARAQAEATLIATRAELEAAELRERAEFRRTNEEAIRQLNMESVFAKSIPYYNPEVSPDAIDHDWIVNFFEKCRVVSDEEMQQLWARVLAGEANAPGAFSRKTVNTVANLGSDDAQLFSWVCRFGWTVNGELNPVIFYDNSQLRDFFGERNQIGGKVVQLEEVELLSFRPAPISGYVLHQHLGPVRARYCDRPLEFTFGTHLEWGLPLGDVAFTRAGRELAAITTVCPIDGFYEEVARYWEGHSNVLEMHRFPARPIDDLSTA